MTDLMQLIPHHKTDSKLDTKHDWNVINEVAELKVRIVFLRKKKTSGCWLCWLLVSSNYPPHLHRFERK